MKTEKDQRLCFNASILQVSRDCQCLLCHLRSDIETTEVEIHGRPINEYACLADSIAGRNPRVSSMLESFFGFVVIANRVVIDASERILDFRLQILGALGGDF